MDVVEGDEYETPDPIMDGILIITSMVSGLPKGIHLFDNKKGIRITPAKKATLVEAG
jgi:hypothetical protein